MISSYLNDNSVHFLKSSSKNEALFYLVNSLVKAKFLKDGKSFFKAILKREKIVSTGVGLGIAIPHAKMDYINDFFITIGIQKDKEGIEWESLDGIPVRAVFMIGGPSKKQDEYLKILSKITLIIKNEKIRNKIFTSSDSFSVIEILKNC